MSQNHLYAPPKMRQSSLRNFQSSWSSYREFYRFCRKMSIRASQNASEPLDFCHFLVANLPVGTPENASNPLGTFKVPGVPMGTEKKTKFLKESSYILSKDKIAQKPEDFLRALFALEAHSAYRTPALRITCS